MNKKILRILSLAMAIALLICIVPAEESSAAQTEADQISQQVVSTYKTALKRAGRYSFHGYCGDSVAWQLRVLGITTGLESANGNGMYDRFKDSDYSSGGFRIRAYSASSYSLLQTLNTITNNGTTDAYNIMVGFQRTNTTAGRKYGHACFIHAIIDGVVYFTESYGTTFNGKYYAEGACITGTIEQFAKYYNSWTSYDGIIYFGLHTYTDCCEEYPAYLTAAVTQETQMYLYPCTPEVDDRSQDLRMLQAGETVTVTGLYRNPEGEYWYRVEDHQTGYILADAAAVMEMLYDDVTVSGVSAPTTLLRGNIFNIKGVITSTYNKICSVRAQVFSSAEEELDHVMTTTAPLSESSYSLSYSTVSNRLAFRLLELGSYRYELAVVASNYYYADGELQTEWKTVKLYRSDFQVVDRKGDTVSVSYDANGGAAGLNAAVLSQGQTLNTLPEAVREGYVFAGWFTAAEGGEKVAEDYAVTENVTLYAQWTEETATGFYEQDGKLYYLLDGKRISGFFQVNGVTYYQYEDGFLAIGWIEIEGLRYYFSSKGCMTVGWLEVNGSRYYFGTDGTATIGWAEIGGYSYYFDDDGVMQVGRQSIGGQQYVFSDKGVLES